MLLCSFRWKMLLGKYDLKLYSFWQLFGLLSTQKAHLIKYFMFAIYIPWCEFAAFKVPFWKWQETFSLRFTKQNFKHRLIMLFITLQLLMANFKYCVKYIELWTFFWSSFSHMWPKTKDLPRFLGACKLIKIRRKLVY